MSKTNLLSHLSALVALVIIAAAILLAAKSQLGHPTITELNTRAWTEAGPLELSPERARFALLYSLVEDKSFQFKPEVARLATPDLGYKNGHFVSLFAPGPSLLMIPGYRLGTLFGASHLGATLVVGLAAFFNVLLIWSLVVKLGAGRLTGYLSGLIFLLATPAFNYAGVLYQHHFSTLVILLALRLSLLPISFPRLALLFFLFTLSAIIDVPNAFFMLPIMFYVLWQSLRIKRTKVKLQLNLNLSIVPAALFALIPVALYLMLNYASYGNALQLSNTVTHIQALDEAGKAVAGRGADQRAVSDAANLGSRKRNALTFFKPRHLVNGLYAFTISPDRGVLTFTPVILLGLLGLVVLYRLSPAASQMMSGIILINLLLYSMRSDPWGGWAFGSRYLIPSYAILAVTLGLALERFRRQLLFLFLFLGLTLYSLYVNTAGALSSTANPPRVEVLSLEELSGRQERYSFDRNLEYLQAGKSQSFIYKTYLKGKVKPSEFFLTLYSSFATIFLFGTIFLYLRRNK